MRNRGEYRLCRSRTSGHEGKEASKYYIFSHVKEDPIKSEEQSKCSTVCMNIAVCGKLHEQMVHWQGPDAVRNSISKETSTYASFIDVPLIFNEQSAECLGKRRQFRCAS